MALTSFTATVNISAFWTDDTGQTRLFQTGFNVASLTKPLTYTGLTDNSGWDVLYQASEITRPEGDVDPGDVPLLFIIEVKDSDAILRITDSAAGVSYKTVEAGEGFLISGPLAGSTSATTIAKIEIQSSSATDAVYNYALLHD